MLEAILGIVAAVLGWWAKRKIKNLEDEKSEYKKAILDIDLAVANGDQDLLNNRLELVLRKLQDKPGRHSGRQGSHKAAGR
jgi:predicted nucleotidyltransferase